MSLLSMDSLLFGLLAFLALIASAGGHSHAGAGGSPAEKYWKSALPNSHMPASLSHLLDTPAATAGGTSENVKPSNRVRPLNSAIRNNRNYGKAVTATEMQLLSGNKNYGKVAIATEMQSHEDAGIALFFLEEDIQPGKKLTFHFVPTAAGEKFLPRIKADAIPFSSDKIPEILSRLSVNPQSTEAARMTATLHECEEPVAKGEKKACATSLESMVDFATSILGTSRVKAVSTIVGKEGSPKQVYAVTTVKSESASLSAEQQLVVCHAESYAYAVFLCHLTRAARAYTVSMVGKDGVAMEAVAVCHVDTTGWNPMHIAFQMLKVKPGTVPICHFLVQNDVVWARSG